MSNNPTIILTGHVRNGRKIYYRPILAEKLIEQLEGQEFEEVIRKKEKGKTPNQLAYYFGGIIKKTCMESTLFEGWNEQEVDAFFRQKFLGYITTKTIGNTTENIFVADHLSNLSTVEMAGFIDRVIQFLAENDIIVLTPGEYEYGKYEVKGKDVGDDW